jgi:SAM-dependent methyltransferase
VPTVPPEPSPPSDTPPHRARQIAESFGSDPELYDRARPRYPDALIERIVAVSPGRDILDVGCGTGIAARQFRAAGCAVLGLDPDPRMAEVARRAGVEVEVATFEAWDPAGRAFDAVVAGQSWHWIDPGVGAAKAAQVLRPDGRLAIFAHVFEPPPPVLDAFATAYGRAVPDSPFAVPPPGQALNVAEALFAGFADGIRRAGGFSHPEHWRFDWERPYTRDEWLALLPTTGGLTRLPPDSLASVLAEVGAAIDGIGGAFTLACPTLVVSAVRTGTT